MMEAQTNRCRVCLKVEKNDPFISIFGGNSKAALRIFLISGVQIIEASDNPAVICHECTESLHYAFQLRKKCIEADDFFRSIISNEILNGNWLQNLEEINIKEEYDTELPDEIAQYEEIQKFDEAPEYVVSSPEASVRNTKDMEVQDREYKKKIKAFSLEALQNGLHCCHLCDYKGSKKKYLDSHILTKHHPKRPKDMELCSICNRMYNKHYILKHQSIRHFIKAKHFSCDLCEFKGNTKTSLNRHMLSVHIRKYSTESCPFCKKTFKSKYLEKHIKQVHTRVDPEQLFYCDLCSYVGKTKTNFKNHFQFNHIPKSNEQKWICSFCGKISPSKKALWLHENTHLDRKVTCHICSKEVVSPYQLKSHIRLVHERSFSLPCSLCSKIFVNKGSRDKHVRIVHMNEKKYSCTECDMKFGTAGGLKRHFTVHTGEKAYECIRCARPFRLRSQKLRHEKICKK